MGGTELAALLAAMLMIAVLSVVFLGIYQSKPEANEGKPRPTTAAPEDKAPAPAAARRRNAMGQNARLRDRRQEAQQAAAAQHDSDSGSGSEDEEEEQEQRLPQSKKERRKQEKQDEREARAAQQDRRENKLSAYEERKREQQDKREALKRAQEDEMQRSQEERLKKEEDEAAQWMSMIKVEQEGTGEGDDQQEGEGLLAQFIDFIKQRKTVPLEQLATEFKLRTTDVIDRVQGLEAMGHLTGVMDERGKYIYISKEEMQAVANYINNKGRVAISELAANSSTFIDLEAKATATVGSQPGLDFDTLLADSSA